MPTFSIKNGEIVQDASYDHRGRGKSTRTQQAIPFGENGAGSIAQIQASNASYHAHDARARARQNKKARVAAIRERQKQQAVKAMNDSLQGHQLQGPSEQELLIRKALLQNQALGSRADFNEWIPESNPLRFVDNMGVQQDWTNLFLDEYQSRNPGAEFADYNHMKQIKGQSDFGRAERVHARRLRKRAMGRSFGDDDIESDTGDDLFAEFENTDSGSTSAASSSPSWWDTFTSSVGQGVTAGVAKGAAAGIQATTQAGLTQTLANAMGIPASQAAALIPGAVVTTLPSGQQVVTLSQSSKTVYYIIGGVFIVGLLAILLMKNKG